MATKEAQIPRTRKNAIARLYNLDPADPIPETPSLYVVHKVFSEAAQANSIF